MITTLTDLESEIVTDATPMSSATDTTATATNVIKSGMLRRRMEKGANDQ